MNHTKNKTFLFWIACLVSLGGILYGYDIGVISGALLFIQNSIPMTDTQTGIIVGAVLAGGLAGTLLAGPVGDRYGRRFLILLSSVIFMLGVCLILLAHSFLMMLYARLLLGVGVGVVAVAVPLYVAEIVPAQDRGKYMTFFQLLLTFGIVLAYVVDLIFTSTGNWRAMFAVVLVPALILFLGMLFLPETPRWLMANNHPHRARDVLLQIRPSAEEVEKDMQLIQSSLRQTQGSWLELFSRQFWVPTLIAVGIAIFNQLTGINSFLQYAPLILKNAGIGSDMVTMIGSAGIGLLNFLCTIVAIALIDTLGRRPLLLTGVAGVMVSECYLGAVQYLGQDPFITGLLSLAGLFAFIVFFAIGPGVVVWLAISELFPTRVRGKGIAFCLFFNSLASTVLATFFLSLSHTLGMSQTYWLFAFFTLAYFLIAFFLLPETKTKSLEEIQFHFEKKHALAADIDK
ncbi:sugar porter family MFS transporter [Aquicella lusitana]|uniref:Sugar porter (SP) family MFS transporter n=1 Tax=Aquicella lusitana TaxID=254246 RepID=A0A370GCT5_9COXI|nr:sugar porter family MFS transporter [Aquicella lusitana]RDI40996.1 sugar porter (SP) family MFS transporter [Aquicella lusitana]VVC73599.1 putative metabolite transport protein CsbC [Aquicella lusitana]